MSIAERVIEHVWDDENDILNSISTHNFLGLIETQATVGQNNRFPCKLDSTILNCFSSYKTIQNGTVHCVMCY